MTAEPGANGGGTFTDRIVLDVIGSALLAIAEEIGEALIKASYSSNIKDVREGKVSRAIAATVYGAG